jgi:arsenite/tail-anchored protein-transporting ATPase
VSELYFFVGKGGVGKTTLATAFALARAQARPGARVLLISTDPAHSLADLLQTPLGDTPTPVRLRPRGVLAAWEINPARRFRRFLRRNQQKLVTAIERASLFTAEEISALLETTLPGLAEIAGLLAIQEAMESCQYSSVVVDTAPFGHTLRLFDLPRQFLRLLRFLNLCAERDRVLAEHFGGVARAAKAGVLEQWRAGVEAAERAFDSARLMLVTTAENFALNESMRAWRQLRQSNPGIKLEAIILNRVVLRRGRCQSCRRIVDQVSKARRLLEKEFRSATLYLGEDPGSPILGTGPLQKFAAQVFGNKPSRLAIPAPPGGRKFVLGPTRWPNLTTPLSFVVGKGGVGKTTISAGLGYVSRRLQVPVAICSVDPAPSLADIFATAIGDELKMVLGDPEFRACEFDSVALYRRWVEELRSQVEAATSGEFAGVHVDISYEKKIFLELLEMVPPGLDEVLAVFRIMELQGKSSEKVIVDMAPTGHALELLRMPERILVWTRLLLKSLAAHRKLALAREVAAKIAEFEVRARELSRAMRAPERVTSYSVMLAEPLPDRETERLVSELRRLGLKPKAMFVNRVLVHEPPGSCARCHRAAQWQAHTLARLAERFPGLAIYVNKNFDREIAGKRGLGALTGELWRLK